jgi:hypothetical protein
MKRIGRQSANLPARAQEKEDFDKINVKWF